MAVETIRSPGGTVRNKTHSPSRRPLALAAAFALVVALEATLFGVYGPAKDGTHERRADVLQIHGNDAVDPSALVTVAAIFISVAGMAFPFFLRTVDAGRLPARAQSSRAGSAETAQPAATALALFSTSASLIHFAVLWEHFHESWLAGAFFAITAPLQLAWSALVLLRPSRALLRAGVLANLGVAAVWLLSRTAGLPLGPQPWAPEPVGVADALATALEALIVVGATVLLREPGKRLSVRPRGAAAAAWTLGLVLVPLTSVALLSAAGAGF